MKKSIPIIIALLFTTACNKSGDSGIDYRAAMRDFVVEISKYAKSTNPGFNIIPQNGIELVSSNQTEDGPPEMTYLNAIDGNGQEDLWYGYDKDDKATPVNETKYLNAFLTISKKAGKSILATDYCSTPAKMADSYNRNKGAGYISFAADHRALDNIPSYPRPIYAENSDDVTTLDQARNFLYLINPQNFTAKTDFINALASTNYDLIITDLFFEDDGAFTIAEINRLKQKANGGKRLVVCYLSIGEAEDYRYYWQSEWRKNKPVWMEKENPDWAGNFKVRYWDKAWQDIIFGNDSSYLKKIINAGFDGVYLDIIDAYEYFE